MGSIPGKGTKITACCTDRAPPEKAESTPPAKKEVLAKSLQLCPTLCHPMNCSPTRLLCPWDSPGKNTGMGCCALLQGIFPTQGLNSHLLPYQAGSLPLEPPEKPGVCICVLGGGVLKKNTKTSLNRNIVRKESLKLSKLNIFLLYKSFVQLIRKRNGTKYPFTCQVHNYNLLTVTSKTLLILMLKVFKDEL